MSRELYGIKGCNIELHNSLEQVYSWDYINEVHIQKNVDHNIIIVFCEVCDDELVKSHIDKMIVKNYCKDMNNKDFIKDMEFYNLTRIYSSYCSSYEYPAEFIYAYTDNFKNTKESNIKKEINTILSRRHISECVSGITYRMSKIDESVDKLTNTIQGLLIELQNEQNKKKKKSK